MGNDYVEIEANEFNENVEFKANVDSARTDLCQSSDNVEQFVFNDSNDLRYEGAVLSSSDTSDSGIPDTHAFQMEVNRLISRNNYIS